MKTRKSLKSKMEQPWWRRVFVENSKQKYKEPNGITSNSSTLPLEASSPQVIFWENVLSYCVNLTSLPLSEGPLVILLCFSDSSPSQIMSPGRPHPLSWGRLWTPNLVASTSQLLVFIGVSPYYLCTRLFRASGNIWFIFDYPISSDNGLSVLSIMLSVALLTFSDLLALSSTLSPLF